MTQHCEHSGFCLESSETELQRFADSLMPGRATVGVDDFRRSFTNPVVSEFPPEPRGVVGELDQVLTGKLLEWRKGFFDADLSEQI